MPSLVTPNHDEVKKIVVDRLAALEKNKGVLQAVNVDWRGGKINVPVISMPVNLLHYNPNTHRIRAQLSTDMKLEKDLHDQPYSSSAQGYLHHLLMGDPAEPSTTDPSFLALKDDLREHGQREPGIITQSGVLINGNTRRAALRELGIPDMLVGVLPSDAGLDDLQSIELSLQLHKDFKRDYSFMNFLLAIDERTALGQLATRIQSEFRIRPTKFEQCRWILEFVRDAIKRSETANDQGKLVSLRLADFEAHQGKLEELYRAYQALAQRSKDDAEALREQRLLALILNKSKTDLRLIEPNFVERYMKGSLPQAEVAPVRTIPGTSIRVAGPSSEVLALRQLTTAVLQARSVQAKSDDFSEAVIKEKQGYLRKMDEELDTALDRAGKQGRVLKRRLAAVDRLSDACDDLELAVTSVAEARATDNFDAEDVDEKLVALKINLEKLATIVLRGTDSHTEGLEWLRSIAKMGQQNV